MIETPEATRSSTPQAKAEPPVGAPSGGIVSKVGNLVWLLRQVVDAAPRSARLWIAMTLTGGLITPVQLWATKGVADNLQERLGGGPGPAMWWFAALWVGAVATTLLAERVEGIFAATARDRVEASFDGPARAIRGGLRRHEPSPAARRAPAGPGSRGRERNAGDGR